MNYSKLLSIAILSTVLFACGGSKGQADAADSTASDNPNELILTVESQLGQLGDYITITDPTVKFVKTEEERNGEVRIEVKSNIAMSVNRAVASDDSFVFETKLLDKDHNEINCYILNRFEIDSEYDSSNIFHHYLNAGSVRAKYTSYSLSQESWDKNYKEIWDKLRAEGGYIVFKNSWSSAKYKPYGSSSSDSFTSLDDDDDNDSSLSTDDVASSDNSSSAGSKEWDEALDAYERYVNNYKSVLKKVQSGDPTAMANSMNMIQEAEKMQKKLEGAKSSMTPAQTKRYLEITQSLSQALK